MMTNLSPGTAICYTGWLPPHVTPWHGVVVRTSGASVLVDVDGRMVWCDAKNVADNRDPIFVGVFRNTLLRVRCVCNHGNTYVDCVADDFVPTFSPQTTVTL